MPKPIRSVTPSTSVQPLEGRIRALDLLFGYLYPYDLSASNGTSTEVSGGMDCAPCDNYKKLKNAWRIAMKWTEGLDRALVVMLASIASTKTRGDQLWVKIISPASGGKSTLCEALTVSKEYIISKDTFTGLSSGYQTDKSGGENLSLVEKIRDKTLIINDGDTLLQLPNLAQVLSQLRAFYGRNLRTSYKNKMSADHEGYNTTIILCGTSSLRQLDASELGERFLDCVIMEKIDDELEDEILQRVANRAERNTSLEATEKIESQHDPDMIKAMQLTGGYVNWLRENAVDVLSTIAMDDDAKLYCIRLGKYTAYMRARPSDRQEENAEREFAARLVSQLTRLAKCLALVLNCKTVDDEVMGRVRQVALDTSRGQTMEIIKHLYEIGSQGSEQKAVAVRMGRSSDKVGVLLRFLMRIGVVEVFTPKRKGVSSRQRWRLTERLYKLHEIVIEGGG